MPTLGGASQDDGGPVLPDGHPARLDRDRILDWLLRRYGDDQAWLFAETIGGWDDWDWVRRQCYLAAAEDLLTMRPDLRGGAAGVARRLDDLAERLARVSAALDGIRAGTLEVGLPRPPSGP
jgi:hypothetical protein